MNRKHRETVERLEILKGILEKGGFQVVSHTDNRHDPYIYVGAPFDRIRMLENLSFRGVGVYARGEDVIAFRCQNGDKAEPFGTAYPLDVKAMFKDLVNDEMNQTQVGKKIMEFVVEELKEFFIQSAKAERHLEDPNAEDGKQDQFDKTVQPADFPTDFPYTAVSRF